MEGGFANKEIVWAKVKGYPWWPAEIAKLPTPDANVFKVIFIAEDTHAFLNPKDVKKYTESYDEFSKKKMRGLAPAIQAADELYKKRIENQVKTKEPAKTKTRPPPPKTKPIRKTARNANQQDSQMEAEGDSIEEHIEDTLKQRGSSSEAKRPQEVVKSMEKEEEEEEEASIVSEGESVEDEKFLMESEERVDRAKIDTIEESLLRIIEQLRQGATKYSIDQFKQLTSQGLSGEELVQSKITNMLSFILHHTHQRKEQLKEKEKEHVKEHGKDKQHRQREREKDREREKEKEEGKWLALQLKTFTDRTLEYLNDTSYYDQYIKLIQRNKRNRSEYENKLVTFLKTNYKMKKELAIFFAQRLVSEVNNGAILKEKELLEDIKEKRADITSITNKAAIERSIETLIPKYM